MLGVNQSSSPEKVQDLAIRDSVVVFLSDHADYYQMKLKHRFETQQKGRVKWFRKIHERMDRKREQRMNEFLPIEFVKHRDCVMDYIRNGMKISTSHVFQLLPPEILRDSQVMRTVMRKVYHPKLRDYGDLKTIEGFDMYFKEIVIEKEKLKKIMSNGYGEEEIQFVLDLFNRGEFTVKEWEHIRYLDEIMKKHNDNVKVVTEIVKIYGRSLQHASSALKNMKKIVMLAINQNPEALEFASDALKRDIDVVKKAVSRKGTSLNHASPTLKNNKEIVMMAIENDKTAYHHASDTLKKDKEIMIRAQMYAYASDVMRADREFALMAVHHDPLNLHLVKQLQDDRQVVLQLVKKDGMALQYVSPLLKQDSEIIKEAILQNACAAIFIPKHIQDNYINKNLILDAIKKGLTLAELQTFYDQSLWDKEIFNEALQKRGSDYSLIPETFKDDSQLLLAAVRGGLHNSFYMDNILTDREMQFELVKSNVFSIINIPKLRKDPELVHLATLSNGYYFTFSEQAYRERSECEYSAILHPYKH